MKITYLIGNGFDIAAGLPTSYQEFLTWYCGEQNTSGNITSDYVISRFKKEIQDDTILWGNFELTLAKYTEKYAPDKSKLFLECFNDVQKQLAYYMQTVEKQYNKENIITDSALNQFCDGIAHFSQETTKREQTDFNNFLKAHKNESCTIQFISFNYTNLLDLYVKAASEREKDIVIFKDGTTTRKAKIDSEVLHIHGTTSYYPLLGVDNIKDIGNQEMLQDSSVRISLLKNECVNDMGEDWYDEAFKKIDESSIICIFGMSLGQSDSLVWKKVISWLQRNYRRQLIVFWHIDQQLGTISWNEKREPREYVKDILMKYYNGQPSNAASIKGRIHVVINAKKMLAVPLAMPKNEVLHFTEEQ